jgi:hypothetical protein
MSAPSFGLCDRCTHQRLVRSGRGATFSMCEIGLRDPGWPKYPGMPVTACPRFSERPPDASDQRAATRWTPSV